MAFLQPGDESKIAESVDDHEHEIGTVKETEVSEELAVNEKTVHLGAKRRVQCNRPCDFKCGLKQSYNYQCTSSLR